MTVTASTLDTARVLVVGSTKWVETVTRVINSQTGAAIQTATTVTEALDTVRQSAIDCVVTEYTLGERTGIELVTRLKETMPSTPVILGTTAGSEAVASEAIRAGVTDYFAVTADDERTMEQLVDRTADAVRSAKQTTTRHERAQQFEAVFQGTQTATWVLNPDGTLKRVNQPAREMIGQDGDALVGEPFWTLPWWNETETTRQDVRQLVATARGGRFSTAVVFQSLAAPPPRPRPLDTPCREQPWRPRLDCGRRNRRYRPSQTATRSPRIRRTPPGHTQKHDRYRPHHQRRRGIHLRLSERPFHLRLHRRRDL